MPMLAKVEMKAGLTRAIGASNVRSLGVVPPSDAQPTMRLNAASKTNLMPHCSCKSVALLALLGMLCACEPPARDKEVKQAAPPRPEKAIEAPLSKQQVGELSAQCEKLAREKFRRAWKGGSEVTAEGRLTAVVDTGVNDAASTGHSTWPTAVVMASKIPR